MSALDQTLFVLKADASIARTTMYDDASTSLKAAKDARVVQDIQELEILVKQEQDAINLLKVTNTDNLSEPSEDPHQRFCQLRNIKMAYKKVASADPFLPSAESALPALLAVRDSRLLIFEVKESIMSTYEELANTKERLIQEEAILDDSRLLTEALENRIEKLRLEYDEKSQKTTEETVRAMIEEQQNRKKTCERETRKLIRALVKFVNEHLSAMLAAEELGGPVVGDLLDITDDGLDAGFNQKGNLKKIIAKKPSDVSKRQRIDQIWGQSNGDGSGDHRNERDVAASEMRILTEELLNTAESGNLDKYVTLQRESAAARFLVRAKVAQFHPRDARKLCLIDFGRALDN